LRGGHSAPHPPRVYIKDPSFRPLERSQSRRVRTAESRRAAPHRRFTVDLRFRPRRGQSTIWKPLYGRGTSLTCKISGHHGPFRPIHRRLHPHSNQNRRRGILLAPATQHDGIIRGEAKMQKKRKEQRFRSGPSRPEQKRGTFSRSTLAPVEALRTTGRRSLVFPLFSSATRPTRPNAWSRRPALALKGRSLADLRPTLSSPARDHRRASSRSTELAYDLNSPRTSGSPPPPLPTGRRLLGPTDKRK